MKKFVLDTNVLLLDHQAMFKFEENEVYIPIVVLEELDNFKKEMDGRGYNARETARYLDKLSKRGPLHEGVELDNGGKLFVQKTEIKKPDPNLDMGKNDNIILQHALNKKAILVSRDINVRLKARAVGLQAEDHEPMELKDTDVMYKGHSHLEVTAEEYEDLRNGGMEVPEDIATNPNEYFHVESGGKTSLCINKGGKIVPIHEFKQIFTIKARNKEQRFLLDALSRKDINLVTVQGKAGTGKTLLAIAGALNQVLDGDYTKLIVARPIQPMGKDLGFLPGDLEDKLGPWMKPICDNIDFLFEENRTKGDKITNNKQSYSLESMQDQGILEIEALTYIRGRSIPNQYIIIDEAQNLSAHEIKTIITRAGENTKIVLTGDIEQIDSPYLDQHNNGFSYVISKFRDQEIAAHVTLEKGERSELADIASKIL